MIPAKEELVPFNGDKKSIAKAFKVTDRTVYRWLKHHGLDCPKKNFGPYKLDDSKAKEIRRLHASGISAKLLAKKYGVTIAAIGRVLNNITYREIRETAEVYVIYNPAIDGGVDSSE